MKSSLLIRLSVVLLACMVTCPSRLLADGEAGGDSPSAEEKKKDNAGKEKEGPAVATIPDAASAPVVGTNTVVISGQEIRYATETGMLPLLKQDGVSRASVFYVAYTVLGDADAAERPVMFCFNGGPGSSAVWLHLGGLGPRRVVLNEDGTMPPPPFRLEDNAYSVLNATDLVFIDPVATGYSRPTGEEKREQFFGQTPDVESVGDFIRLWTTRHERWRSPKYLCGESYGAFRAAALADHLLDRYGMYLNGVVLLSGVLDFATLSDGPGNPLAAITFLPAFTAAAHFHGKLPPDLQADLAGALAESRAFALNEYAVALLQGASLPESRRGEVAARLARLTGLPQQLIEDNDLRVSAGRFREFLLRDEGLIIGRFDARITGRDADRGSPNPQFDPSYVAAYGPFSATMNAYLREELLYTNDLPYEILTGVGPWEYDARNRHPDVTGRLGSAMSRNPYLRVLVLGGRCDLACPPDGVRYSLDHMRLDPALRANIRFAEYASGHMMYVHRPDMVQLQQDLEQFLRP